MHEILYDDAVFAPSTESRHSNRSDRCSISMTVDSTYSCIPDPSILTPAYFILHASDHPIKLLRHGYGKG